MGVSYRPTRPRPFGAALLGLLIAPSLAGCETPAALRSTPLDVQAVITPAEVHVPKAAVAMASIDGAPGSIAERLRRDMTSEAATRDIPVTDPTSARYVLRGYLDAYATETGTSVHSVWDVYDTARQRTRRLDDAFNLPASADADIWSGVNDEVLAGIASRSADDLAVFLAQTPEASGSSMQAAAVPSDHAAN